MQYTHRPQVFFQRPLHEKGDWSICASMHNMSAKTAIEQFLHMDMPIRPGHSPRTRTVRKLKLELEWKLYARNQASKQASKQSSSPASNQQTNNEITKQATSHSNKQSHNTDTTTLNKTHGSNDYTNTIHCANLLRVTSSLVNQLTSKTVNQLTSKPANLQTS